jgi:hypothetical protein
MEHFNGDAVYHPPSREELRKSPTIRSRAGFGGARRVPAEAKIEKAAFAALV